MQITGMANEGEEINEFIPNLLSKETFRKYFTEMLSLC